MPLILTQILRYRKPKMPGQRPERKHLACVGGEVRQSYVVNDGIDAAASNVASRDACPPV